MSLDSGYMVVCAHMIGDYSLQTDFLAKTKGDNWWHMIVHCLTYTIPFAVMFGVDWRIVALFATHVVIDSLKAKWHMIGYVHDQIFHLVIALALYF